MPHAPEHPGPSAEIGAVVDALDTRLRPRRLTLLGDVPGTNEMPALITALADEALERSHTVVVVVEIPMTEQARIDTGDLDTLLAGPFWNRPADYDDGRSSPAMAEMLVGLVRRGVTVVAADGPWVGPGGSIDLGALAELEADRDEGMARRILAAPPGAVTLGLLGVEHVRVRPGPDGVMPAGAMLARWEPGLVALAPTWCGGSRFGLAGIGSVGGPMSLPADGDPTAGAWWATEAGPDGFHGTYCVGPFTPSPSSAATPGA